MLSAIERYEKIIKKYGMIVLKVLIDRKMIARVAEHNHGV
jgi:hypothetical protein